ncbi:MAG: hypothetical protein ACI9KE_004756, partial [Polyangiales bacterium]
SPNVAKGVMKFGFSAHSKEGAVKPCAAHRVLVLDGRRRAHSDGRRSVLEELRQNVAQLYSEHLGDREGCQLLTDRSELIFAQRTSCTERAGELGGSEGEVIEIRGGSTAKRKALGDREAFPDQSGQTNGFSAEFPGSSWGQGA